MAQVINTNILSLNAQRNLNNSQDALSTSLERLSSGLRINSAQDDAAGLAISERFTTQIRGLNQASRNANDGISLAQTAEAALGEVAQNLQRIRELAVQAVNATNSDSDRATLNQEVQQRLSEIDRISSQTSFNGRNVLDGTFGTAQFQVGANVGETIGLDLNTSTRTADVGAVATATSVDLSTLISEGSDPVTGSAATYTFDATNLIADYSTVAATPTDSLASGAYTQAASDNAADAFQFLIDGAVASDRLVGDASAANLDTDIAAFVAGSGGAYTQTGTVAGNDLVISKADGTDLTLATSFSDAVGSTGSANGTTSGGTFATGGFIGTHTGGTPEDTSANATFTITDPESNALSVTLDSNITSAGDLLSAIQGATGYGAATFTAAAGTGNEIVITDGSNATGSFSIGGADASLITDENVPAGTTAGVADDPGSSASTLAITDLTVQFGDSDALTVENATYATVQSFADAVNEALGSNGTATLDSATNVLSITSGEAITIGGTQAGTVFSATDFAAAGSLSTANVSTVAGANSAIFAVDSALTSVSDLRSTFGAIQNRFESTIANLASATENLSAARSRILDADFAAETAALTRAQILQQAGISVLAQANAQPQSVLALLN